MLSDESSSDSETGRFKCQTKSQDPKTNNSSQKNSYSRSSGRSRRTDDRLNRDLDRKRDERDRLDRRSRERHRYGRYSPVHRRPSRENKNRRSPERHRADRHRQDLRARSKQKETRSHSKDRYRRSRSKSQKSPVRTRNIKDEIKEIIIGKDKYPDKDEKKTTHAKSSSPEVTVKKSTVHKPSASETLKKNSDSPIVIPENDSDTPDVVQPGSYYSMIPAIVKEKPDESSEIDSSDDERLRAKLLNLEKELQKTKKKKHKKKHKRKSVKSDREKQDSSASVEVSSTTDIQEAKSDVPSSVTESAEVTSTQKNNQKESSEEGEILSEDNSQSDVDIDPTDLRHKLKRSKIDKHDKKQKLDVCGPALPPHMEKRFKKSTSPVTEGPLLPPHLTDKSRNIGNYFVFNDLIIYNPHFDILSFS